MTPTERRIATETVTSKIDGVNTVVAEAGQPVPVAYDHLVPDSATNVGAAKVQAKADSARARKRTTPATPAKPEA